MSWKQVVALGTRLPGVELSTSYGTPALKHEGQLLMRLLPDGELAPVRVDLDQRSALLDADPDVFSLTDHYRAHPWVLVRLGAVTPSRLEVLLRDAIALISA